MKASDLQVDEKKIERMRAIIYSMTPDEREHPEIIKASRKKRIAAGSGTSIPEINQLLKQFETTKDMMKKMMRNGGKRPRFPF